MKFHIILIMTIIFLIGLTFGCIQNRNILVFVRDNHIENVDFGTPPLKIVTSRGDKTLNLLVYSEDNKIICNKSRSVGGDDIYVFDCNLSSVPKNHFINIKVTLKDNTSTIDSYSKMLRVK
jgi:hypothetical protein